MHSALITDSRADALTRLRLAAVAEQVARLGGSPPAGAALDDWRQQLTRVLYRKIHLQGDPNTGFSDRGHLARLVSEVQVRLGDLVGEYPGWSRVDGATTLRSSTGVEVDPADGAKPFDRAGELVVRAPGVALGLDANWIYWVSPHGVPKDADARLYVHFWPGQAVRGWVAGARALAAAGLSVQTKLSASPARQRRPDGAVVYLTQSDIPAAAATFRQAVADCLTGPTAGFAYSVAPGLGVGLFPPRGEYPLRSSLGFVWAGRLATAAAQGPDALRVELNQLGSAWAAARSLVGSDAL